jgi:hypothetical protein
MTVFTSSSNLSLHLPLLLSTVATTICFDICWFCILFYMTVLFGSEGFYKL